MFGVLVNAAAIIVGSIIGLIFRKRLSDNIVSAVITVTGLCTLFVGIKGSLVGENYIVVILALVVGTAIGTALDIEGKILFIGEKLKSKFAKKSDNTKENFAEAFVTTSILFGVGAMAITGSIEAGLKHEYTIFFVKSTLDFVSGIVYTASLGLGVMFSSITILVCQGIMTLLAGSLTFLANNEHMMNELSCVGNIMIIAISLNILKVCKLKVADMLPAIIFAPLFSYISTLF